MKLLNTYVKEMKIAARGFYFYVEVFMAIIILVVLLVAVKDNPVSKEYEFLFYDMPTEVYDAYSSKNIDSGSLVIVEDTTFESKAISFDVTNKETGVVKNYNFDKNTYVFKTYEMYDLKTGEFLKTLYIAEDEESMIHMSYLEKKTGATITIANGTEVSYKYFIQGYETERFSNLLYILHNETNDDLEAISENQTIRKLGYVEMLSTRENMVPVMVVFMGSLMGFFIVMSYIFLDKAEGVIRAFAVTPSPVWKYLFSKTMVIMTTVIISSSIITIPIMGTQPSYLLFYLLLIVSTFTFAALGLLVASFFDSISKAFGALYIIMIFMLLPGFSYYIPGFDPLWLRFFPTYPLLQGFKEIIMLQTDVGYVLTYSGVFLVGGIIIFLLANNRFKKTLTV